jgi:hypothetical protein
VLLSYNSFTSGNWQAGKVAFSLRSCFPVTLIDWGLVLSSCPWWPVSGEHLMRLTTIHNHFWLVATHFWPFAIALTDHLVTMCCWPIARPPIASPMSHDKSPSLVPLLRPSRHSQMLWNTSDMINMCPPWWWINGLTSGGLFPYWELFLSFYHMVDCI